MQSLEYKKTRTAKKVIIQRRQELYFFSLGLLDEGIQQTTKKLFAFLIVEWWWLRRRIVLFYLRHSVTSFFSDLVTPVTVGGRRGLLRLLRESSHLHDKESHLFPRLLGGGLIYQWQRQSRRRAKKWLVCRSRVGYSVIIIVVDQLLSPALFTSWLFKKKKNMNPGERRKAFYLHSACTILCLLTHDPERSWNISRQIVQFMTAHLITMNECKKCIIPPSHKPPPNSLFGYAFTTTYLPLRRAWHGMLFLSVVIWASSSTHPVSVPTEHNLPTATAVHSSPVITDPDYHWVSYPEDSEQSESRL